MSPKSKIEFTGGTLYFGDRAVDVRFGEMMDFESVIDATDDFYSVAKIIKEPIELTGTIDIKFKGLVKLLGFWPAVKYEISSLIIRIKKSLHIVSASGRH